MGKPLIGIICVVDESGAGRPFPRPYVFLCTNYVDAICRAGGLLPYARARLRAGRKIGRQNSLPLDEQKEILP